MVVLFLDIWICANGVYPVGKLLDDEDDIVLGMLDVQEGGLLRGGRLKFRLSN